MNLYIKNHPYRYETEKLTRLFYPNEKLDVIHEFSQPQAPYILTEISDCLRVEVRAGEHFENIIAEKTDSPEDERMLCEMIFGILCKLTGITPPWGMVTGVRPVKYFRSLKESFGGAYAEDYFKNKLFVSDEKLALAKLTEKIEKKIIDLSQEDSFSLYIAIPFCPTRCHYCSFVQSSIERSARLVEPYVDLLCEEIKSTAGIASDLGLKLETVYMGGGTPTTLSADQLSKILGTVRESFDMRRCREFTVEAGRPDTVTEEKLNSLLENKVDRISINPQTLNDSVLQNIGRRHTAGQFFEAYALARKLGFNNINTDLIAGLPGETVQSFQNTMDGIIALDPECVTVHTLSMKRSSTLTQDGTPINREDSLSVAEMLSYAAKNLTANGWMPYYLYRQSRMVGNLENTGWSKQGFESFYNIYVMDETHTILGCGAGAVTKLKQFGTNHLERVFNFKYPYEYIGRYSEQMGRKKSIYTFYEKY